MTYTIDEKKVIYADLDPTEGVLLHLETKNYYRLNETCQQIWQGLSAGKAPEEIAEALTHTYSITKEEAQADVAALVSEFRRERLLQGAETRSSSSFSMESARQSKKDAE